MISPESPTNCHTRRIPGGMQSVWDVKSALAPSTRAQLELTLRRYIANPLAFPAAHPQGYPTLKDEPEFDARKHLAIELPSQTTSLSDFGYPDDEIAECPTDLAITSTFRILSPEGAACLLEVARLLEPHARSVERISRMVRGGAYQSKFLRDFCSSPVLAEAMSNICRTPLLPHTIPHQLGHLNYNPEKVGENVDKWHVDTLRIDFVLFVTDPNSVEGGEFEYFRGTKTEVENLKRAGMPLPAEKIVQAELPGPGYAVLQQGNMVVHRAKALSAPGERITLVNGYVPRDVGFPDFTRFDQLALADPEHIAASEYSRHITWMGREALDARLNDFHFSADRQAMASELEDIASILSNAARNLRSSEKAKMEHFGDE